MNNPACAWCDDTGVMWDRQHSVPALCNHCERGNTEQAVKYLREVLEKRMLNAAKEKLESSRVAPSIIIKWKCEKCHDVGFIEKVIVDERGSFHGELVPCECQAEAREKAREEIYLKLCRLPEARPEWTLDKFVPRPGCKEMLAAALGIVAGKHQWLFLISPSGYGKTHIAVGVCREFLRQGKSARYIYVPDLIQELREGIDEEGKNSYRQKMNFFSSVKLLALDDLGTENSTPWVREQLDTIIDHRYVDKLALIITTNKSLDELMPRTASRIKRAGVEGFGKVIAPTGVPWDEYVKKAAK